MIKLLGVKRAMILGLLLLLNLVLAGAAFAWVLPLQMDAETRLNVEKSQITQLQGDIQRVKEDLLTLKEKMPQYDALRARGFLQAQDRFMISRTLDDLKNRSGLMGFSFVIGEVKKLPNADATAAQKDLIASRIQLEKIGSHLDVNFFKMLDLIETIYPPHARIHSFELRKAMPVTPAMLATFAAQPRSLINATIKMDWLTLADIPAAPEGTMPGMPGYPGGN